MKAMTAKQIIESKTDDEIKQLISDYFQLHTVTAVSPENYRLFVNSICSAFGSSYNIHLAETFLIDEVFKRFIKKP